MIRNTRNASTNSRRPERRGITSGTMRSCWCAVICVVFPGPPEYLLRRLLRIPDSSTGQFPVPAGVASAVIAGRPRYRSLACPSLAAELRRTRWNVMRETDSNRPRWHDDRPAAGPWAPLAAAAPRRAEAAGYFDPRGMAAWRPGENDRRRAGVLLHCPNEQSPGEFLPWWSGTDGLRPRQVRGVC